MTTALKIRVLLAALLSLPLLAVADDGFYPLAESAGVVQDLDFAHDAMVIDGMRYQVAVDVKVEIGGSYGAFTMLEEGMRVYYEFLRISDAERRVTAIRELPAGVELGGV